jgi:hypothetical protein
MLPENAGGSNVNLSATGAWDTLTSDKGRITRIRTAI